jgi:uncharacterized membrane protein
MISEIPFIDRRRSRRFDMEQLIGLVLLVGVLSSMFLIVAGCVWRWINTGHLQLEYEIPATNLYQFWIEGVRQAIAGAWRPRLLINLGIALLMATPYFRVLISVFLFAFVQRNLKYTLFTLFVFCILTYSLFFRITL